MLDAWLMHAAAHVLTDCSCFWGPESFDSRIACMEGVPVRRCCTVVHASIRGFSVCFD